jgi:hypothetical protein
LSSQLIKEKIQDLPGGGGTSLDITVKTPGTTPYAKLHAPLPLEALSNNEFVRDPVQKPTLPQAP